ncbi:Scavenger receptor class B member 1 [Trachymyrmex septentrionalis]|uniref:Scavenger receptor class B member 1 n=1 Tax=Trachymyrmex septentrionalis TaxID=34720 RepID=A0A195FXV5_9HYME|nr:PREDICTED: lysosome membrane protein 2-like [Trachymyrmex septentrionalis]KYN44674.1 Scavenger receptor class B member 1 [Trachymyrmex septentrionalis]
MTISMTDTALDIEKKAIGRCARRSHRLRIWIYCGIFLISSVGFYMFWYADVVNNYVLSSLELRNGTLIFDWWERPPLKMKYNIYIFNYTNVDEFEANEASKLRVQELGPYVYQETMSRMNVMLHDNGTITYQTRRSYKWIGGRPENDIVVVPNVPLMFATAYVRDLSFAVRFVTNTVLSTLQEQSFISETANGFLWGYDTQLFHMAKPLLMLQRDIPFEKFGMLAMKTGLDKDRITMHTGSRDKKNFGMIDRVNGLNSRVVWDDEQCDKIEGTEGIFSPYLIQDTSKPLYVYAKDMCRKIPLHFAEQVTIYDIPSLRYKFTPDAYNFSNKQNECFCPKVYDKRVCPPSGLFNMSACNDGTPMLISFPHFYGADKSLLEQIDGLNPRQEDHEAYVDLHPRLAIALAGRSRMQLNLEVRRAIGVPFLGNLKDGMILPLIWIEIEIGEPSEQLLKVAQSAHFTVGNIELALQWGTLITMILSFSAMIACLWKSRSKQDVVL